MSMNNEMKQTPLMQVKWEAKYTQHKEGMSIR